MTTEEKIDFLIKRQSQQFEYFEKRFNMLESRLIALQSMAVTLAVENGAVSLPVKDLTELIEATRDQTLLKFSEFPSWRGEMPESFDP